MLMTVIICSLLTLYLINSLAVFDKNLKMQDLYDSELDLNSSSLFSKKLKFLYVKNTKFFMFDRKRKHSKQFFTSSNVIYAT